MTNNQKTLRQLKAKVKDSSVRMPSIKAIHELLLDKKIPHSFYESTNTVEHRSAGNRYVNDRHDGKIGKKITFNRGMPLLDMDTSSSYYSWNTYRYAIELVEFINKKHKFN